MKNAKCLLLLFVMMATFTTLPAQTTPEPSWFIVDYMKVKPGMWDKYLECEKVWKTIHKERIRLGHILDWSLYQVLYPGGTSTEYDYVTITEVKGWNGIEKASQGWGDAYKVVTKEQMPIVDKTDDFRDFVKTEVYMTNDAIFTANRNGPAKYQVCNYMQIAPGKWNEYFAMEKELFKPVHKLNLEAGKRNGWGLYELVLPYGSEIPYQAVAVDFYDKWEDIGSSVEGAWEKAHPGMKANDAYVKIEATRSLLRQEVRLLVDHQE